METKKKERKKKKGQTRCSRWGEKIRAAVTQFELEQNETRTGFPCRRSEKEL